MLPKTLADEIESFEQGKKDAINSYKHDGKYLVIAGPGTGKTFTISKRIEAILSDNENGTSADRILCLTFSDAAAGEMRKKIPNSSNINIYTFHSFCLDLMEKNPELFDMRNKKLITPFQKQAIVKECLENLPIKYNRSDNSLYANIDDIIEVIEAFKHYRIEEKDFETNLVENLEWKIKEPEDIEKIREAWKIYQKYKELSSNFIDFDDMIDMVLKKFDENPEFLKQTAEQYAFVMVDEYQDTNKSQNDIVFKLAEHCKNILVVGDDDQIIYTFQGASLDTIDGFLEKFKDDDPKIFCILENRRSTENILKVSEQLANIQDRYADYYVEKIQKKEIKTPKEKDTKWFKTLKEKYNLAPDDDDYKKIQFHLRLFSKDKEEIKSVLPAGASKSLKSIKGKGEPVIINSYVNEKYEKADIVKQIQDIITDENKCPVDEETKEKKLSEIAILVKANEEAEEYATLLKEKGIRVQLVRGKNIFNANSVKTLIAYMQFFNDCSKNNSDKLYHFLLSKPFHISHSDYNILQDRRIKRNKNILEQIKFAIKLSDDTIELKKEIAELKKEIEKEENVEEKEKKQKDLDEKIKKFNKEEKYIFMDKGSKGKFQKLIDDYKILEEYKQGESIKNLLHQMACVTGILQSYISLEINRTENIEAIQKFIDLSSEYASSVPDADFEGFVDYIEALLSSEIEIFTDKADIPLNAVQVSTLHSSKGREFEYVFMPNLVKNKYEKGSVAEKVPLKENENFKPILPFNNDKDKVEDKKHQIRFLNSLKLLYVGMTRAKKSLVMSYQSGEQTYYIEKLKTDVKKMEKEKKAEGKFLKVVEKKEEKADLIKRDDTYENKFKEAIKNIKDFKNYINQEKLQDFEKALDAFREFEEKLIYTIAPNAENVYDYDYKEEFWEYIKQNLQTKYSASSLNTYLDCPKKYLCRYILNLRPYKKKGEKEKNYSVELGNSIHYALEEMVHEVNKEGKYPDTQFLFDKFEEKIKEELDADLDEIKKVIDIKDQKEKLETYYKKLQDQIPTPTKGTFEAEKKIEYTLEDEYNNKKYKVDIVGKIDRLDKNDDGTYNIIDYKTGSKKGKSDFAPSKKYEEYYNQLAIYRYILERQGVKIKDIKIVQPQHDLEFSLTSLMKPTEDKKGKKNKNDENIENNENDEKDTGLENCNKVVEKYKESIEKIMKFAEKIDENSESIAREVFDCKPGCKKDKHLFCDYKGFCKKLII